FESGSGEDAVDYGEGEEQEGIGDHHPAQPGFFNAVQQNKQHQGRTDEGGGGIGLLQVGQANGQKEGCQNKSDSFFRAGLPLQPKKTGQAEVGKQAGIGNANKKQHFLQGKIARLDSQQVVG